MIRKTIFVALLSLGLYGTAFAAADPMLFRLFLTDGTSVISYGEFARVDDRVIFSMVMGGGEQPRLLAATLPANAVDWQRTDEHVASTRYQWYAKTRGEEDFQRISDEVAAVLNEVLLTNDRAHALDTAREARATLAAWPGTHFGYRQQDMREIIGILDEAISDLRAASGVTAFAVDLVASAPDVVLEALPGMPSLREQIDQAFHVAALSDRPAERVSLYQSALALLGNATAIIAPADLARLRRFAETEIRNERLIDSRYDALARRLIAVANRGAARARAADVQRVLDQIPREDARLGRRRPEVIQALQYSIRGQLDAARRLRLQRDQWELRKTLYREYQKSVGAQLLQLVKAQPALEAIRRLDGPPTQMLVALQARLRGGAARLERTLVPSDMRGVHDLVLGAWRFAENAVRGRYEAARAANVNTAWQASSSAAGALLLLSRAQLELRALLEPPRLQ